MKKIIICFAITILLFACSKTEITPPLSEGQAMDASLEKAGMAVTTNEASIVTSATATCGGDIQTSGGGGNVEERGICYRTSPNPKITHSRVPSGSGNGSFTSILSGLSGSTLYYARAYAIKSNGTVKYGNQVSFTTLTDFGTVTDIDGNIYHTITIGTQVWMVENLKTTKNRDGSIIPNITNDSEWETTTTGAYCDYDNNPANSDVYGRLYNSDAASNALIAPAGWHTPSLGDFITLANYLGPDVAGGCMKEAGFNHWSSPNTGADNSSGFTAVGAGERLNSGSFIKLGTTNGFWTSSTGYQLFILSHNSGSYSYAMGGCTFCLNFGCSVRCIKD